MNLSPWKMRECWSVILSFFGFIPLKTKWFVRVFFSWVWRSWKCSLVQHHMLDKNSCFGNWWSLVHSWSHSVVTILWDLQQSRSKLIAAPGPCSLRYPCTVLNWQRSALSRFWLMFCFVLFCFPTWPTVFSGVESNFKISTHVVCIDIC